MTSPLHPDRLKALAADYLLGDLSAREAKEIEQLLADHPDFTMEVARLQTSVDLMLAELPMAEPPPHLRAAIMEATQPPTRRPARQLSSVSWPVLAYGAAALFVLVLGVDNYRLRQTLQQTQTNLQETLQTAQTSQAAIDLLRQPINRFYSFKSVEIEKNATGNMIVDPGRLEALIVFENLPPLPEGQVYALWAIYQGQTIACGEFNSDAQGSVAKTLAVPEVYQVKPWVKEVIITVETASGSEQPTGPTIMSTV
ncbi:MAG: anti-sigma factor [Leptolyngbyaceae cyanobacterium MO_188.B28]|nr:anti-sigma factor [Leptolyngbyaceae cyanobacterium MO_188.B28]